jgi:hypothetical protein
MLQECLKSQYIEISSSGLCMGECDLIGKPPLDGVWYAVRLIELGIEGSVHMRKVSTIGRIG